MTGTERRRLGALVVSAFVLLVGLGAGRPAPAGDGGEDRPGSTYAVTLGTITAGPPGLVDTRLQRSPQGGLGQRPSHSGGAATPVVAAGASTPRSGAPSAVVERAEHPERRGGVLLRGPPPSSV